jgi:putative phage-type endonuclease
MQQQQQKQDRWRFAAVKQGSAEWHQLRRGSEFVTASLAPDVMGVGFKSRQYAWRIKMGLAEEANNPVAQQAIEHGRTHEPVALAQFSREYPCYGRSGTTLGMVVHPEHEWLSASPDFLAWVPELRQFVNVEIKCPFIKELPQAVDEVPYRVLAQVQVQMACLDVYDSIIYFWKNGESRAFWVMRDPQLERACVRECAEFREHLLSGEEPPRRRKEDNAVVRDLLEAHKKTNVKVMKSVVSNGV